MKYLFLPLLILLLWTPITVSADEVVLKDGRTFKGKVESQSPKVVKFRTVVDGIESVLILKREDIKKLNTDVSIYKNKTKRQNHPFLEIPIVGKAGEDYFAKSIEAVLKVAKEKGVKDLVFFLDTDGGDLNEALAIYKLLGENKNNFTYHMVVKRCQGVALAVGLWEDSLTVVENAVISGPGANLLPTEEEKEEEMVILAQLATEFSQRHAKNQRRVLIIKALFDAEETLGIWYDEEEQVLVDRVLPEKINPKKVLVDDGDEKTLFLPYEVLVALGLPVLETGKVEDLGRTLALPKWVCAGDQGAQTMNKVSKALKIEYQLREKMKQKHVQNHLESRAKLQKHLEYNMQQASKYDPSRASYATYHDWWGWGRWRWQGNSGRLTEIDREKWKMRTDITLKHLNKAKRTIPILIRKMRASEKLGVKPSIPIEKLLEMKEDVGYKLKELTLERRRRHLPSKKK